MSSTYYTGRKSNLIRYGHSRDQPQIVCGLLCDPEGRPVAVEVFPGNTADPKAFTSIVKKVRQRFGIRNVVFVGDRGMITSARINDDLRPVDGLDWISALRSDGIKTLIKAGHIDRSSFNEKDLAEITDTENFRGERLIVCRNPILAAERTRKREDLLHATEEKLNLIVQATQRTRNPLQGKEKIGLRIGKVIGSHKMEKHFELTITDDSFSCQRREENISAEAAMDGLYVIRTSVDAQQMKAEQVVTTYKSLSKVERAFRSMKSVDLHVRPIYHSKDDRIRAHVFLCMLAYYVEWHMRECLREVLFDDEDRGLAESSRKSIVAPAPRSPSARRKDAERTTQSGLRVQSFRDLLLDLSTLCRNTIRVESSGHEYNQLTESTEQQRRTLELLHTNA